MQYITWEQSLSVGVGILDAQHMYLVTLINRLGDAVEKGKGRDILDDVLNQLKLYTAYHFTSEERLLRIHGYPAYEEHHAEHEEFTDTVEDFSLDLRSGVQGVSAALHEHLHDWFLHHVREKDQLYAGFLKAKGVD